MEDSHSFPIANDYGGESANDHADPLIPSEAITAREEFDRHIAKLIADGRASEVFASNEKMLAWLEQSSLVSPEGLALLRESIARSPTSVEEE